MTFLEMESTHWHEIYREQIIREERDMKSDFQLLATIANKAIAYANARLSQLRNQEQPPQPTLRMGGSVS